MTRKSAIEKPPDKNGTEEWVRALYPEILRYCLFHTASRSEAEDAAQDTFLKAIRHGESGDTSRAFLYAIARNTCIDLARRKKACALPEELPAEDTELFNAEANADFAILVLGLTPEQRELVLLRFQQGLTLRQTADALGVPLRTAQSRLRAALKRIKEKLEKEGGVHAL